MTGAGGTITSGARVWAGPRIADIPVDTPRIPAREAAEKELSKGMYHEGDPGLLERAFDAVLDWIRGLFDGVADIVPGGPLGVVVLVVLAIGLVAALWWRLGTPRRPAVSAKPLFRESGPRGAAAHRAAAEKHAAALRWTEAVQERTRAIVRSLEERALLASRPGHTADEAAEEAGRRLPDHAARLRAAARTFDALTYGGRTADESAYRTVRALDDDLEATRPTTADAAVTTGVAP
ncbi:DUF4129 domain-containing protein [Streptomyces sp. NBC_00102]|uniref:DUF4129 domain-containing protein n=1 Tax=Streptomyces sp. NBC_00102 TaxID=2975652 RepID=UPI00224E7522|nr:DUF4129 domain-containing protein [Streptomyces sp. NBC_00102]MCX5397391.1 DUF4129 domain-containing protein [Streptomyces sp. NBC_00102]